MGHDQETLGQYLKGKREALLMPVQEIARAAGAAKTLIEALENDDYSAFTSRAQAEALVKFYCAHLKLNDAEAVRRFDPQWKLSGKQTEFPKLSSFSDDGAQPAHRAKPEPSRALKPSIEWRLPSIPSLPPLSIPHFPKMKVRWTLLIVILLTALFLLIDLPLTKQKPQPPEDPRFPELSRKSPSPDPPAMPEPIRETKEEAKPESTPPANDIVPPIAASQRSPAERTSGERKSMKVVGNSDTRRYHLPGMKFYDKIKGYHRVVFQSEKEAIHAGYHKARE